MASSRTNENNRTKVQMKYLCASILEAARAGSEVGRRRAHLGVGRLRHVLINVCFTS